VQLAGHDMLKSLGIFIAPAAAITCHARAWPGASSVVQLSMNSPLAGWGVIVWVAGVDPLAATTEPMVPNDKVTTIAVAHAIKEFRSNFKCIVAFVFSTASLQGQ
jgi:hypothetical protein